MKRNWEAHELFRHIGIGRENAIQRPADRSTDRALRKLISETNEEGKVVIINVGNGLRRRICGRGITLMVVPER